MALLPTGSIFGLGLMSLSTMFLYKVHDILLDPNQSSDAKFFASFLTGLVNIFGWLVYHLNLPDVEAAFVRSLAFATVGLNAAVAWQLMGNGTRGSFFMYIINGLWYAYGGLVLAALTEKSAPVSSLSPASRPSVAAQLKGVEEQLAIIQRRIDQIKAATSNEKTAT